MFDHLGFRNEIFFIERRSEERIDQSEVGLSMKV